MAKRVEVTMEDYEHAARNKSARCAVARAVKRAYPKATKVMVDIQTIRFTDGDERKTWLTPNFAQDMIVAFDAGEWSRLEPFSFNLTNSQAHRVQRRTPNEDRNKATREGKSTAGMTRKRSSGPRAPRRSAGGADRAYGVRSLSINKYRAQDGLITEIESVPGS